MNRPIRKLIVLSVLLLFRPVPEAGAAERDSALDGRWMRGNDLDWKQTFNSTNILPRYHAIVIGIQNYKYPPPVGWDRLTTPVQDAREVADILEKQYGFAVTRLFDEQATRSAIISALDDVAGLGLDDAVLIYYAGHGFYDPALGEGFWIPADARNKVGAKRATEDWVWNSVITKMLGASQARHILVVADACYGGSLFRGEEIEKMKTRDVRWYQRALAKPSRYLITSGDYERVLDTGARHSVFAQLFIDYIRFQDQDAFSASEIGLTLRQKVGEMTGQMVRMGPLQVATDAGGEFVFVKNRRLMAALPGSGSPGAAEAFRGGETTEPDAPERPAPPPAESTIDRLKDVALLDAQGASNTVRNLMMDATALQPDDPMVKAVAAYVQAGNKTARREDAHALIARLKELKKESDRQGAPVTDTARPRVLALFGPTALRAGTEAEAEMQLFKIGLLSGLEAQGGIRIVDRDHIADVLQEQELGASDLSDPRARTALGRLLPASSLLYGKIMPTRAGSMILLNMIDTESSEVQALISTNIPDESALYDACASLTRALVSRLTELKPLTARVTARNDTQLRAGVGSFHQATPAMTFAVIEAQNSAASPREFNAVKPLGTAHIVDLGTDESAFAVTWENPPPDAAVLWVRESGKPAAK